MSQTGDEKLINKLTNGRKKLVIELSTSVKNVSLNGQTLENFSNLNPITAVGGLGGTQNYFVNSYLVIGRALNLFLERLSHSIICGRLKKADRFRFYQFDSVESLIEAFSIA